MCAGMCVFAPFGLNFAGLAARLQVKQLELTDKEVRQDVIKHRHVKRRGKG